MIQINESPLPEQMSTLVADRCRVAELDFERHAPASLAAVRYNDRLAAHWKPGIMTRDLALEEAEAGGFAGLLGGLMSGPPPSGRPAGRALVLDLGGGTGKVVDWLEALLHTSRTEVTYLYFDIAPKMRDEAAERFERLRAGPAGRRVRGSLTLADITNPVFNRADWRDLRKAFYPIVSVCAGGTIGNFGALEASDNVAQDLVGATYFRPADAGLVTFLDPSRLDRSLAAYSSFGIQSGLYDGQRLRFFTEHPEAGPQVEVSFLPERFEVTSRHAVRIAASLNGQPFWVKLDMTRQGETVGQVTRHYSEAFARSRFLTGSRIVGQTRVSRATCITFQHEPDARH